jgi:hypothetical protein
MLSKIVLSGMIERAIVRLKIMQHILLYFIAMVILITKQFFLSDYFAGVLLIDNAALE